MWVKYVNLLMGIDLLLLQTMLTGNAFILKWKEVTSSVFVASFSVGMKTPDERGKVSLADVRLVHFLCNAAAYWSALSELHPLWSSFEASSAQRAKKMIPVEYDEFVIYFVCETAWIKIVVTCHNQFFSVSVFSTNC